MEPRRALARARQQSNGLRCEPQLALNCAATELKIVLAFPPMAESAPTTISRMTVSMRAYSAMSWPWSLRQSERNKVYMHSS